MKLRYGQSKRVGFLKLVSSNNIDLIQAVPYNDECSVKVAIVGTFGEVHD